MSVKRELTVVRMRLPGQKVWTPDTCLDSADPRSFLVKSGSTVHRRNQRDIVKTGETPVSSQSVVPKETPLPSSSDTLQGMFHQPWPLLSRLLSSHLSSMMCQQLTFEDHRDKEDLQQDFAIMC